MLHTINKDLVPIKAHYFLYNAATGPIVPFLPTIAKQLGFSGFLVGTMYTLLPISGLIAKPLLGGLADKFNLHKSILLIFQVLLVIGFSIIYFIPEIESSATAYLTCNKEAFIEICSKKGFSNGVLRNVISSTNVNLECQLSCNASTEIYEELCSNWRAVQFCGVAKQNVSEGTTFNFTAQFNVYENLQEGSCIDVRVRNVTFFDGIIHKPFCERHIRPKCTIGCKNVPEMSHLLKEASQDESNSQAWTYQFHIYLWAAVISWIGMAVVVSIGDTICLNILGEERKREYGKQKLWGSIGFGIFGVLAGYLVDVFSRGHAEKDYSCIFFIMLTAMILDIIVSATLRKTSPERSEDEPSVLWELWSVVQESRVLVFAWWCIGSGMCTAVVWNFLFWYIDDLATHSRVTWLKTLQGLLIGIQCFVGELSFNFVSGALLHKLGHINVMSIVLLVYAIRFMSYSLISNLWIFLFVEVLHGPSFGLCWPTMVSYGDKVAPSGTKATMQGFVGAVFEGIGVSSGSFICGWLMEKYGGVVVLQAFSVGSLVWLSIYWILHLLLRQAKVNPIHQGHSHLATYATPNDAILMTMSQELQTY
ncbi:major facilitator superfamily domain-containing protein 6 [Orussus abietinus]|uniref:major facilitator superfamily domain-containing protein 6 n=1 Tax=Orussus abietinus TaxID=222816 RepID=UPI000626CCF7|nr:major facilitator superfamily domain-containing protein 6 [Orussus abietinus]XP_012279439.1 major facilitator superfamily domain-containing protein 6 [Orussus abietinus]XP_023289061.1 major facilitator superfamily domain-containing protein 6 [Orussus abietinus]